MITVFADKVGIGFVLDRRRGGFKAFDINDCTVGMFSNQRQAADAICGRQSARQQ
jgi:hypothetical protein